MFVNANYTFQKENSSTVSINVLLPFIISGSNEQKPPILEKLQLDGLELDYKWKTIQIPSFSTHFNFDAIEFTLSFTGQEEKTVNVQYNRDYQNGAGSFTSTTAHYNFQYYVGTALAWNHNISTAEFEFWIPRSICDEINQNSFNNFTETNKYYIGVIHKTNWMPETDQISIWWRNQILIPGILQIYMLFFIVVLGIPLILLGLVFKFYKRKNNKLLFRIIR